MGVYYKAMISQIRKDYKSSGVASLEDYLKSQEEALKKEWQLPEVLFYLNFLEVFREENQVSKYFEAKFKEASEEDEKFNTESFKKD